MSEASCISYGSLVTRDSTFFNTPLALTSQPASEADSSMMLPSPPLCGPSGRQKTRAISCPSWASGPCPAHYDSIEEASSCVTECQNMNISQGCRANATVQAFLPLLVTGHFQCPSCCATLLKTSLRTSSWWFKRTDKFTHKGVWDRRTLGHRRVAVKGLIVPTFV